MNKLKKIIVTSISGMLILSTLTGCNNSTSANLKVGQITDLSGVDDKSFNQGAWEGIGLTGVDKKYLIPYSLEPKDTVREISNLYDLGYRVLVAPGFNFETAIFEAQALYPDLKIILIDGTPHNGDYNYEIGENTLCIYFTEHESGFLSGVATALHIQSGDVGFIGGMEIPAVQKFNWGFQQGILYANSQLGTSVALKPENFIYANSFYDADLGTKLATEMYDRGVKVIFSAAGGVGVGVIGEAKKRAIQGEDVWVLGVDVDQYGDGLYAHNQSVILTSAMKYIEQATASAIESIQDGTFEGQQVITLSAAENMVGIPQENPNLSESIQSQVAQVQEDIKSGKIVVDATNDSGKYIP